MQVCNSCEPLIGKGIGNFTRNAGSIVKAVKRPESGIVFARYLDTGGQKCYSISRRTALSGPGGQMGTAVASSNC